MPIPTSPDRTAEPAVRRPPALHPAGPVCTVLAGGVPLYVVAGGRQEVCRVELLFRAGAREDHRYLLAGAVNALLQSGTPTLSAEQIAQRFEFFGASVEETCTSDHAIVTVVCLNKFLGDVLPLVAEVVRTAVFPEEELALYRTQRIQRLQVQNRKVGYVSRKLLYGGLFGPASPYGFYQQESDYRALEREQLVGFHGATYAREMLGVVASGKLGHGEVRLIASCFDGVKNTAGTAATNGAEGHVPSHESVYRAWPGAVQTSLRLGRILFDRGHPDFIPMQVVNVLLGGYFGSRLMANIREDKGFAYGIGSHLLPLHHTGCLLIATEVNKESREAALHEIRAEMERLRSEPVPDGELELVRNYMAGMLQRSFDGPFATAGGFRNVFLSGMDLDYFRRFGETIETITPGDVLALAGKYLDPADFMDVSVG